MVSASRADSQHLRISEVRVGPPSDSPRAAMRGPRPPWSARRWRSSSRLAAAPAASARCHTEAGLRSPRRARCRPGRAAPRQRRRHSGEAAHRAHVGDHAAAVDQGAMIDKQENRRLQPEEILERRGPPGHTDAAARTPSRVRQMARLMSITRPPNGARRFASSKGSFAP
jgi:hypothetical protein